MGAIGSFFTGGLNLQIEHHLFPCMAHHLYPSAQRIIKEECAKAGIHYIAYDYFLPISRITCASSTPMGAPTSPIDRKAALRQLCSRCAAEMRFITRTDHSECLVQQGTSCHWQGFDSCTIFQHARSARHGPPWCSSYQIVHLPLVGRKAISRLRLPVDSRS